MVSRKRPDEIDDEETSIYEGQHRPQAARPKKTTRRGQGEGKPRVEPAAQHQARLERDKEELRRRAIELATPTAITPAAPVPQSAPKVGSEPIRVISMKTPGADDARQRQALEAKAHVVKLRAISELSGPGIQLPLGNLAPPRDPKEARLRRARDYVILGLAVVIVGCLVMVGVLLLAR